MFPLRDRNPSSRFPVVTTVLIGLNLLVFVFELQLAERAVKPCFDQYGLVPRNVQKLFSGGGSPFTILTVFTSMFLHGGWLHLIGNMWYLWIFGDNIEDRLGRVSYLLFYLAGGIGAGAAQTLSAPFSDVPMVGASGAIAAVLGAYLFTFPKAKVLCLLILFRFIRIIEAPAWAVLGFWIVLQIFQGVLTLTPDAEGHVGEGVAWWAHVGGFAAGLLLIAVLPRRKGKRPVEVYRG